MKKIKQNIPNAITITRIVASLIAPFLFITGNIVPAISLYIYGAISDCFDGLAARKLNAFTELGRKLDPISDKIFALSLLLPSLLLGNLLMSIPLVLEAEIASTAMAAKKVNINLETERVGKYKTWTLFTTIILGLLATQFPVAYFPLAIVLGYTTHFQVQSIKAYDNQFQNKLNNKDTKLIIQNNKKTHETTKEKIKSHYEELMFYKNIEIKSKPKTRKLTKTRY